MQGVRSPGAFAWRSRAMDAARRSAAGEDPSLSCVWEDAKCRCSDHVKGGWSLRTGRRGGGPRQTPGAGTTPAVADVVGNGWTVGEFLKFRRIHARTNVKEDVDNSMSFKQAVLDSPGSICCFIRSTSASQEPSLSDGESSGMPGPCPPRASAREGVMPPAPGRLQGTPGQ